MARRRIVESWTAAGNPAVIGGGPGGPRRRAEPSGKPVDASLIEQFGREPQLHRPRRGRRGLSPDGWKRVAVTVAALLLIGLAIIVVTRR